MPSQQNGSISLPSKKTIDFLRFFDGIDIAGCMISQDLSDQELRKLQLTCKLINCFLKPQRVTFLKNCEIKTSSDVQRNRKKNAAYFYFRLTGFLALGVVGVGQLYRYAFRILPGSNVSSFKPVELALFYVVCSMSLVQNGYYVYKYAVLPFLNYMNNHNKEVQLGKIQSRIRVLTGSDDTVSGQLKLKRA